MKILLLGNGGQLGWELHRALLPLGSITALDFPEIDLSQPDTWRPVLREFSPAVIINATAYTAVDKAEGEPELAMAVNGRAPGQLAEAARDSGAAFIHYSTDYIFDGTKGSLYVETDVPNPLSEYGRSKLAGEQAVAQVGGAYLIFRPAWVYSLRRDSFVTKVLQWSRQQKTLRVVDDQVSNPTWARALAEITAQLLAQAAGSQDCLGWVNERHGIYHLAGCGAASRYEWAKAILRCDPHLEEQLVEEVLPVATSDFPTPARRPLVSALDTRLFEDVFGLQLPHWELALQLAMR